MSVKTALRDNIAQLLFQMKLTVPERRGCGCLSVVTFHRVLPEAERKAYPFPGLVVTPEELDEFLAYFTNHFDCGTLATQHNRYLSNDISIHPLLALTFDDAQHDNFINARPVLARHNVKASFFVPVTAVEKQELLWHDRLGFAVLKLLDQAEEGRNRLMNILAAAGLSANGSHNMVSHITKASKNLTLEARLQLVELLTEASGLVQTPDFARLMTFEEISKLVTDGHEIGSHSMTHCMMPECDDSALAYEVTGSRLVLKARLGCEIETFCYPNGNSDIRTARAVAQAGYRRAVSTQWGCNGKDSDRFLLRRYDMTAKHVQDSNGKFVPALLALRMSGFYPGLG